MIFRSDNFVAMTIEPIALLLACACARDNSEYSVCIVDLLHVGQCVQLPELKQFGFLDGP